MQFILNSLHLENGRSSESKSADCSCIIHKVFYGQLQSSVTCDKCKNITTTLELFGDLSLDIRNQAKRRKAETKTPFHDAPLNLQDSLNSFTHKEKLSTSDYACHNCKNTQQNAIKQLSLRKLPLVLPIHLKVSALPEICFANLMLTYNSDLSILSTMPQNSRQG